MQRCSERAFARCPYKHECGTIHEATFTENSDCAEFNRKVDSMPMTNADRIRAMSDDMLAEFLCGVYDDDNCGVYQAESGKFINGITILDYDEFKILEWLKQPAEVDNG